jgi:ABC-type transporter Mla MlaB component
MNLEITNYNNFFKIKGVLDRKSLHLFQTEFEHIFDTFDKLTISIEGLESVDRYGVNALAKLHNEAITKHKSLSIIGYGCKDVYEHFTTNDAA